MAGTGELLVPEPMATNDDGDVYPRELNQKRVPQRYLDEQGICFDDVRYAEKAWVRRATPEDVAEHGCISEWPGDKCGTGCGCWLITNVLDPRREQPVWWIQ